MAVRRVCGCSFDAFAGKQTHRSDCPYAPAKLEDAAIVQAQIDGDPLVIREKAHDQRLEKMVREFMEIFDHAYNQTKNESREDANFGFYVDGYTLTGTPIIGEILVTAMDGRSTIIKSASLVAFLERRLSPNVFSEDKPQG